MESIAMLFFAFLLLTEEGHRPRDKKGRYIDHK